ncbi:cilia- and flagella-associated protein 144 isoform X4 [Callorhinus ursinus]|uniref:Protein FAM183A isoform X4 n=1 Tax=Zalophus californianus TaxID=9704 RepID=A0A6P9FJV1_ZALCA|nr:protein FAM183A isoform X4 [Zalophus californianus]
MALRPVPHLPNRASVRRAVRRSRTAPGTAKAMAGRQKEKVIPDEVHQNQILRELYLKELRTQKLYTQYHANPLRKARFLNLIHRAAHGPREKYAETQTESQEIGWDSEPLVNPERDDRRLNHFRVYNDITLYKAKMWSLGEDDRHK